MSAASIRQSVHPSKKEGGIIYYEEIIARNGSALEVINPKAGILNENLKRTESSMYRQLPMTAYAGMLLSSNAVFWDFFDRTDIERYASLFADGD